MSSDKRPATEEEVENALKLTESFGHDDIRKKHAEAKAEGYKDEVCESADCGQVFLACVDFVRCNRQDCAMKEKGGKSLLEMMLGDDDEDTSNPSMTEADDERTSSDSKLQDAEDANNSIPLDEEEPS